MARILEELTPDKCFELINDITIDYDGYNDVENLKGLIDEIRILARQGRIALRESKKHG